MPGRRYLVPALMILVLTACGDSGTDLEPYNQIDGNYSGTLVGSAQGIALNAAFSLTITQNQGDLGGSYSLTGNLSDGVDVVGIQGTGSLDGSIGRGDNPSVNLTITPGFCPSRTANFSGSYDTTNRRLTIAGPVQIFDDNCQVLLTYNSTIILSR